jgi:hypothetical protein
MEEETVRIYFTIFIGVRGEEKNRKRTFEE